MEAREQACEPIREEQDDEDDEHAEEQLLEARPVAEELRRRRDDDRTEDRPDETAEATHHDDGELENELGHIEGDWRQVADERGIHRAANAGCGTAQTEAERDVAIGRDAHRRSTKLVVLDRNEGASEARPEDTVGDRYDEDDEREKDVELLRIAFERPAQERGR